MIGHGLKLFFYSQLFKTPAYPTQSFADQTIIVTGSNVGLGLEAARHFYRLNCAKLILAVRSAAKGESAKEDIVRTVKQRTDADAIEVWPLDLEKTESTLAFAERAKKTLPRLDILVQNAGINEKSWTVSEGFERTIQINTINTFLLMLSLFPKMTENKAKFPDSSPHIVIVCSEAHRLTTFKEVNAPDIYEKLNNDQQGYDGQDRYGVSKLLQILFVRELVQRLNTTKSPPPPVIINLANPGLCKSTLDRGSDAIFKVVAFIAHALLGRTAEVGSRTYVLGASAGPESHGEFMSDGAVQEAEGWIYTDTGKKVQKKVFEQTMKVLEKRCPGVGAAVGL
ncbi:short-chain dehydrogenase protein [Rutstroemia sp. NJR-2017a BVV2]|nr:short-chain dehydrogenase protein [Rutstroemia sp. NJR-2017a BVV2]